MIKWLPNMSSQLTYMERLSFELQARAAEYVVRPFEKRLRQAKTPAEKAAATKFAEAVYRMQRFDRCFFEARKALKKGKLFADLHIHEQQALIDAAELSNVAVVEILKGLQK